MHDASPFRVVDPGFNAILLRSCNDLAALARTLGQDSLALSNARYVQHGIAAMESLWSDAHGQYVCLDRVTGQQVDSASVGGLLAAFAPIPDDRLATLAARIERIAVANRILEDCLALISESGFAEYYSPMDGTPCGGGAVHLDGGDDHRVAAEPRDAGSALKLPRVRACDLPVLVWLSVVES